MAKYPVYPEWEDIYNEISTSELIDIIDNARESDIDNAITQYIKINYDPIYWEEDDEEYDRWKDEQLFLDW